MKFKDLSQYVYEDLEKVAFLDSALEKTLLKSYKMASYDAMACEYIEISPSKYCPQCGREYPEDENFCLDCSVSLKEIRKVNVKYIVMNPTFKVEKSKRLTNFEDILTQDNLDKLDEFDFTIDELNKIILNIKRTAFRRMDRAIKDNEIYFKDLSILDKVLLFAKSFIDIEYKSYGQELGYFEFNKICIDDRQLSALQITTLIHELTHFLIKEIFTHILCEILDCTKTSEIESIAIFILSYTPVNQLIDEYAAHTVEGRFTLLGYQDYSSYLNIEKTINAPSEEIEMIKTIGNSLAAYVKRIFESFINDDLLEDIKSQFRCDILESPDYTNLALENCMLLNDMGMIRALKFILADGFAISMDNIAKLEEYDKHWL